MQISAIRLFRNNIPNSHIKTNSPDNIKNSSINNTTNNCVTGKNDIPNISFGNTLIKRYMNEDQDYLCKKFLEIHKAKANNINPNDVKKYFENLGIPYNIKMQSEKANKIIAYCCYSTNEIIRQMHLPMPSRIETEKIDSDKYSKYITVATCSLFPQKNI